MAVENTNRIHPDDLLAALDGLADGFVLLDAQGRPLGANRTFRLLVGAEGRGRMSPDELTTTLRLDSPEGQELRDGVARAAGGATAWVVRMPISTPTETIHRSAWVSPVGDDLVALTFPADDARLEILLAHATDVITVLEPDGRIRYSNPAAGALTGYEGLVLAGTSAFDLVHPDDRDAVMAAFAERLARPGRSEPVRFRLLFGDGSWHTVDGHVNNLVEDPGVGGLVVTLHDVSDIVRAEQERVRSEDRFRSLVENLTDVIVVLDANAEVTYVSPAIDRIIGAPAPTHIGLSAFNDIHPDDLDHTRQVIEELLGEPGGQRRFEIRLHHVPDDIWRWVDIIAVNQLDDPAVEGIVCTLRDVTELKQAEQGLRAAFEHEREVARQLREADRLKDEFLATVSHELRTPLTSIVGFAEVLRKNDQLDPALSRQLIERVAANADDMRGMIEQILDVSRLEAGRVVVYAEPLPLADAVQSCIESLADRLGRHRLEVDVPPDLVAMADRDAVAHVLRNLLTNAAKFSPAGSSIRVRGGVEGDHGDTVRLEVGDEGPGIPLAEQSRVFERFFQATTTAAPPGQRGTGLGLSIAQRYVELQGGRIWVDSEPSRGSTFAFTLPAARGGVT